MNKGGRSPGTIVHLYLLHDCMCNMTGCFLFPTQWLLHQNGLDFPTVSSDETFPSWNCFLSGIFFWSLRWEKQLTLPIHLDSQRWDAFTSTSFCSKQIQTLLGEAVLKIRRHRFYGAAQSNNIYIFLNFLKIFFTMLLCYTICVGVATIKILWSL